MILPARTDAQSALGVSLNYVGEYLSIDGKIPAEFTKDGKGKAVVYHHLDDSKGDSPLTSLQVFDDELNVCMTMSFESVKRLEDEAREDYCEAILKPRLSDCNSVSGQGILLSITQTLFNDDVKYEMVLPVYDEYFTNGERLINGFKIVNDEGQVLYQNTFSEKIPSVQSYFYRIGDSVYLEFNYDYKHLGCYLIEPGKSSSSMNLITLPKGLKAMPNVARASENVNLTFPEIAETRTVSLVNTSGRVVRTDRIAAGIGSYSLNTGNLAPGLYVVTLSDGTTSIETAKIIIR